MMGASDLGKPQVIQQIPELIRIELECSLREACTSDSPIRTVSLPGQARDEFHLEPRTEHLAEATLTCWSILCSTLSSAHSS